MKEQQSGRSMIEMLGVLALIGVLSVGGIHGYTLAMEKYRVSKMQDELQQLMVNVRSILDMKKIKTHTRSDFWYDLGIFNDDNFNKDTNHGQNMFDGQIDIETYEGAGGRTMLSISYTDVPHYACIKIAGLDFDGGSSASGLISMNIDSRTFTWTADREENALPLTLERAMEVCDPVKSTMTWHMRQ